MGNALVLSTNPPAGRLSDKTSPRYTPEAPTVSADEPFFWTWQTTYNGSAGGINCAVTNGDICSRSANSPLLQPGEGGTGHVTITTVNGVPCQNTNNQERCEGQGGQGGNGGDPRVVPEPPASLLLTFWCVGNPRGTENGTFEKGAAAPDLADRARFDPSCALTLRDVLRLTLGAPAPGWRGGPALGLPVGDAPGRCHRTSGARYHPGGSRGEQDPAGRTHRDRGAIANRPPCALFPGKICGCHWIFASGRGCKPLMLSLRVTSFHPNPSIYP